MSSKLTVNGLVLDDGVLVLKYAEKGRDHVYELN